MTIKNVPITAGSGTLIGVDEVSGSQIQYLKIMDGTADSASPIRGDSTYGLDVDVTRLPAVKIDSGSSLIGIVNVSGSDTLATEAKQDDLVTAVGLLAKLTDTQPVSATGLQLWDNGGELFSDIYTQDHAILVHLYSSNADFSLSDYDRTRLSDVQSIGSKEDARSTATDTTAVSEISLLKEISYMEQIPASRVVTDGGGSLTVDGTVSISGSVSNGLIQGLTNTEMRASPVVVAGSITAIAAGDNNIGNVDIVTMPTVTVNPHNVVIASGSIMSGAIASGAVASGAIASGAVASGAFASGAISASAMADGAIVTVGAKTDARSTSTDATSTSMMAVLKEISYMEQNPASRAVTNAGTFSVQVSSIAAGDNNIGNVDIASSIPAGSNAIGKLAANSGVDIGDVDVTSVVPGVSATNLGKAEDAVHASGDTGVMGLAVRKDTASALAGADGDYAPLEVDASGRLHVAPLAAGTQKIGTIVLDSGSSLAGRVASSDETSTVYNGTTALTPKFFAISASMANSNTLVAGVAGKKIRVTGMALMSASTVNVKFQSGAGGTDLTGYFPLVANTGFVLPDNPTGWFETTASALLNMFTSASVSLGGCGKYLEV